MSALWARDPGSFTHNIILSRQYELRTLPSLFLAIVAGNPYRGNKVPPSVLTQIYGNVLNSWLYGALVEMAFNGSQTTLTSNDWAFAPLDLSNISVPMIQRVGSNDSATRDKTSPNLGATTNVTVDTPALRGRIECASLNLSNTSNWLTALDFSNRSEWDRILLGHRSGNSLGASKDLQFGGYMSLNKNVSGPYTTFLQILGVFIAVRI